MEERRDSRAGAGAERRPDHGGGRQRPHDPENTERIGMSTEAAAADEQETMASTGNSEASFVDIVAGTATGLGIDRGEAIGTGGLAAGEDLDPVAEGDYWRENLRSDPYAEASAPYERTLEPFDRQELEGETLGETSASGFDAEDSENED